MDAIGTLSTPDLVVAGTAVNRVVAGFEIVATVCDDLANQVVVCPTVYGVIALSADQDVLITVSGEVVVTGFPNKLSSPSSP